MAATGSIDPAINLLIEEPPIQPTDRVLILHADDPALAVAIGRKAAETVVYDLHASLLDRVRQQVTARQVPNVQVRDDVFPTDADLLDGGYDVALLTLAKSRDYTRGLLWAARRALRPDGKLYMAGPTDTGAKTLIADAGSLFGASTTLAFRRRHRIGVAIQPETPGVYPAEWGSDPTQLQTRTLAGVTVCTLPGVFSWNQLDDGTALLLDHLTVPPGARVLDVGCGNGVIGLVAATRGASHITLTDDSLLAVRCARAGVIANGLTNADVQAGDVYAPVAGQQFDLIVSNPPFHKRFDVDTNVAHRLIGEAKPALRSGGRLIIVANAFLKYDALFAESLASVRKLAETSRFVVLEGRRG